MVRRTLLLGLLALALAAPATAEGEPGIRWESDLEAGLGRAAQEGRPVLLAVNALAEERANQRLRHELYPSAPWGDATREYVCFVANPDVHGNDPGACAVYPGIPCAAHQAVLSYVVRRFEPASGALISPQHIVLEPDGGLAFRKEYYTSIVSPRFLGALWVGLAPELAYERAGLARDDRIRTLEDAAPEEVRAIASAWLGEDDPLAVAGILRVFDFSTDDRRRLELIRSLAAAPPGQLAVVDLLADQYGARPDDEPEAALALAGALLGADRERGLRLLARILVRSGRPGLRSRARVAWLADPADPIRHRTARELPSRERALLAEALLLSGEKEPRATDSNPDVPADLEARLRRAQARAGRRDRLHAPLAEALEDGRAGGLRASLYAASPEAVREHAAAVRAALRERPEARVRYAAAIALLGAGLDEGGRVPEVVWEAVTDPVEGPEARREAVRRLGEDPGANEAVWREAVAETLRKGS